MFPGEIHGEEPREAQIDRVLVGQVTLDPKLATEDVHDLRIPEEPLLDEKLAEPQAGVALGCKGLLELHLVEKPGLQEQLAQPLPLPVDDLQVQRLGLPGLNLGDEVGEIALDQGLLLGHRCGPQEDLLQFRHVTRPGVLDEAVHHLPGDAEDVLAEFLVDELNEVVDQQRDVFLALPQRRHIEGDHVETIVEIVPEGPFLDHSADVLVGGRHHPCAQRDLFPAPDPLEFTGLEDPQQARLKVQGQLVHLVEEERAEARLFELADLAARGARKGPLSRSRTVRSPGPARISPRS